MKNKQKFLQIQDVELKSLPTPFNMKPIIHTGHEGSSLSAQIIHLEISSHQTL